MSTGTSEHTTTMTSMWQTSIGLTSSRVNLNMEPAEIYLEIHWKSGAPNWADFIAFVYEVVRVSSLRQMAAPAANKNHYYCSAYREQSNMVYGHLSTNMNHCRPPHETSPLNTNWIDIMEKSLGGIKKSYNMTCCWQLGVVPTLVFFSQCSGVAQWFVQSK
jgi:hypothetical protein